MGLRGALMGVWEGGLQEFSGATLWGLVLTSSSEGHLVTRRYVLFLHLWTLFPRPFLPLFVLC